MRTMVYLVLAVALPLGVAAQETDASEVREFASSGVSSLSLLDEFLLRTRNAEALQFGVTSVTTHTVNGVKTSEELDFEFAWNRENFAMAMRMAGETLGVVIKGGQMLMSLESKREYVRCAPPRNLGTFVGWLTNEPILKQFFRTPPFDGVKQLYTVHSEKHAGCGGACYELALAGTDMHVWLERDAEGKSQLQRIVADTSRGGNHPEGTHVTELLFTPMPAEATRSTSRFELDPPEGFAQVDWFSTAGEADSPRVRSLKTLSGAPLPPFDLERLGGDAITLTELRGKQVILLDFWTTWCRPCRSTLKTLDSLKDRFGDKLYTLAVNVLESKEKVQAYQKDFGLESDIAFDSDGFLAAELGVEFFPCAILIGLEGTIQAIHIGSDRLLEPVLAEEIEQVIAGHELIESKTRYTEKERLHYRMALNATEYCNAFVNY